MPRHPFQTIIEPYEDVRSLRTAVLAIKEIVEVLSGQRGDVEDHAVTFGNLPYLSDMPGFGRLPNMGPWEFIEDVNLAAAVAQKDHLNLAGFDQLWLRGKYKPTTADQGLCWRVSTDNGATFISAASAYAAQFQYSTGSTGTSSGSSYTQGYINGIGCSTTEFCGFDALFTNFNKSGRTHVIGHAGMLNAAATMYYQDCFSYDGGNVANALRIMAASGNLAAGTRYVLMGLRG